MTNGEKGYDRYECNAPIVNISFDPKAVFMSISSADGYVQIRSVVKTPDSAKKPIAQFKACASFNNITYIILKLIMGMSKTPYRKNYINFRK